MPTRRVLAVLLALLLIVPAPASADKIDDLTRALMQDPSYKVRVQAALVLGKLDDKRAVPALIQALHDENETVRGVAATSLGPHRRQGRGQRAHAGRRRDPSEFVRTPGEEGARAGRRRRHDAGGRRRPKRARASMWPSTSPARARAAPSTRKLVRDGARQGAAEAADGDAVGRSGGGEPSRDSCWRRSSCRATSSTAPSSGCRRSPGGGQQQDRLRLEGVRRDLPRAVDQDDDAQRAPRCRRARVRRRSERQEGLPGRRRSKRCGRRGKFLRTQQ